MLDYPEKSPVFYRDMTRDYPIMDQGMESTSLMNRGTAIWMPQAALR